MKKTDDDFQFSQWLSDTMKEKHFSIMDLESRSGITNRVIWNYLHGKTSPTLTSMQLILKALGKKIKIIDA